MKTASSRYEHQARTQEERKVAERKRALLVLVEKYLLTLGYAEICSRLEAESKITLEQYEVCDNVDLYLILAEYQHYFDIRFGRPARIVRKLDPDEPPKKQGRRPREGSVELPIQMKLKKKDKEEGGKEDKKEEKKEDALEVAGTGVGKDKDKDKKEEDEFVDVRVTRGMPDYSNVPQLRDLANALQRDICIENPNVRFEDIVGLDEAKRLLKEAVMLPLKYPYLFKGILEPWRGVLLYGPPGTGKTMLARAVATECRTTFFNISASSIVSKWRGESEKLIRVLFDLARHYQPSTIFLDELDSILSQRTSSGAEHEGSRRMKTELLIQLDGLIKNKERVFLLAASNMPWDLDIAMLRRLEKRILVALPPQQARARMVKKFLEGMGEVDFQALAQKTEGYSGSDLRLLCKEAAMKPLRRLLAELEKDPKRDKVEMGPVREEDLNEAFQQTKPSPGLSTDKYQVWATKFGSV